MCGVWLWVHALSSRASSVLTDLSVFHVAVALEKASSPALLCCRVCPPQLNHVETGNLLALPKNYILEDLNLGWAFFLVPCQAQLHYKSLMTLTRVVRRRFELTVYFNSVIVLKYLCTLQISLTHSFCFFVVLVKWQNWKCLLAVVVFSLTLQRCQCHGVLV